MSHDFFQRPVPNSPYAAPTRHRELDATGLPAQRLLESRRPADFITPIPKPKKQKDAPEQESLLFEESLTIQTATRPCSLEFGLGRTYRLPALAGSLSLRGRSSIMPAYRTPMACCTRLRRDLVGEPASVLRRLFLRAASGGGDTPLSVWSGQRPRIRSRYAGRSIFIGLIRD
jgi:hypothetical protein